MMNKSRLSISQRIEGEKTISRAIDMGLLKKPERCGLCGQTEGIIEYHISDYRPQKIIGSAKPLCWTCHRMLLLKNDFKKEAEEYFKNIREGKAYPPIYKNRSDALYELGLGSAILEIYGINEL